MEARDVLKRLDWIQDLPTLPSIAMEVNRMLQNYDTSIKDLSQVIEKDQAIVSKIMRLVNSAFFGFRSKISNIPHAVTLLGYNTIRNATISVSIIRTFSGKDVLDDFDITEFWAHSAATAVISRYLAEQTRLHPPDDCFLGGLLHDIGKVILAQYFPDIFATVWLSARENDLPFYKAEKKEVLVNHAQIGGHLAKKWGLPGGLTDAIRWHHGVRKSVNNFNLLMIVHLADILANCFVADPAGKLDESAIYPDAAGAMKLQLDSVSEWFPRVSGEIESACRFFLGEVEK